MVIENLHKIDTAELNKWGFFSPKRVANILTWSNSYTYSILKKVTLISSANNKILFIKDGEALTEINLTSSKCNFGGYRYWFECPVCSQRVRTLHLYKKSIACRECYNLPYKSQMEGGIIKAFGVIKTSSYLENEYLSFKKTHYRGRLTKRYQRFLKDKKKHDDVVSQAMYLL